MTPVELSPITITAIENLFQEVVTAVTGEPCIIEPANGPQPAKRFCSLDIKTADPMDHRVADFIETDTGDLAERARNETRLSMAAAFWGKEAMTRATSCMHALQSYQRVFDLWRLLGFSGVDPVQATGSAYLGKIQDRAQFTIYFYAALGALYPADWFTASRWGLELPEKPYHEDIILPEGVSQ